MKSLRVFFKSSIHQAEMRVRNILHGRNQLQQKLKVLAEVVRY